MHVYADTYKHFPLLWDEKDGTKLLSWRVYLLPYLEQEALYASFHLDEPWIVSTTRSCRENAAGLPFTGAARRPGEEGNDHYVGPVGEKTIFEGAKGRPSQDHGRHVNTIRYSGSRCRPCRPLDQTGRPDRGLEGSQEGDGVLEGGRQPFLTAFCDGSVHAISEKI